jgi:hypothetical protein
MGRNESLAGLEFRLLSFGVGLGFPFLSGDLVTGVSNTFRG